MTRRLLLSLFPLGLTACSRQPSGGAGKKKRPGSDTPGGQLYAEMRRKWRGRWWDVFWPSLHSDGSLTCRVGTRSVPPDLRVRFGLPAEPPEGEETFGGFRVKVLKAETGYSLEFCDAAIVAAAGSETKPHYHPLYKPKWGFWDGSRKVFLESFAEEGIKVSAPAPSLAERTTRDPFPMQRQLMGMGDPLNNSDEFNEFGD